MKESTFRFKRPILLACSIEVNPEFDYDLDTDVYTEFDVSIQNNENNNAFVALDTHISATNNPPFDIHVQYMSEFEWEDGINEDDIKNLLNINAPSLLLSYVRQTVVELTSSTAFPTFHIPFVDFTEREFD